jgi:DNA (cytosine-5)-methyltransferase 1
MKDNDNEQTTETASIPTYLSLCSGYDGIGIALKRVIPDLRTIAHVEIEAFAICNLVTKMEEGQLDSAPVFTDLKRFPFEDLRERQPTILSAGFPCQPFSSSGKRQSTDDPRHLYPFIADGITACRPEYVFLENVDGIVSSKTADGESVLLYVLRDLETRGYTCSWGTFSAAEVGAPHLRKRVFILAKYVADGESIERQRTLTIGDRCERPEETVGSTCTLYPSRPGERQYEWEEPRVVGGELADTKSGESGESQAGNRRKDTGGGSGSYVSEADSSEAQSELGGTVDARKRRRGVDAITNRVDRLRLLGNGVVPDCAELAFRTLCNQLHNQQ